MSCDRAQACTVIKLELFSFWGEVKLLYDRNKFTAEELEIMKKMDRLLEEANNNPEIASKKAPESLYKELKRDIAEYEAGNL